MTAGGVRLRGCWGPLRSDVIPWWRHTRLCAHIPADATQLAQRRRPCLTLSARPAGLTKQQVAQLVYDTVDANGMRDHVHIRLMVGAGQRSANVALRCAPRGPAPGWRPTV